MLQVEVQLAAIVVLLGLMSDAAKLWAREMSTWRLSDLEGIL